MIIRVKKYDRKERRYTRKWERLTMVQAMPGVQPKMERTRSQEKNRINM